MSSSHSKSQEAGRRAAEKSAKARQREQDIMGFQRRQQDAESAKLLRLRALRLAKLAAEHEEVERAKTLAIPEKPKRAKRPAIAVTAKVES
jgi:hypothetical protein